MNGITDAVWQLVILFGPLIVCITALHFTDSLTQKRMTRHFGWRSNLWTGWLGAPVHEYSHAWMARLFGLRVEKVVPFQPDRATGRLGYVVIAHDPHSTWQSIGYFFVCHAPLLGGTLALLLLTLLFYPGALQVNLDVTPEQLFNSSLTQAFDQLREIVNTENFATFKFWIFSYLVLAVGCHLAPSPEDYRNSMRGHGKIMIVALIVLPVFILLGGLPDFLLMAIAPAFLILQANFIFAVMLCTMVFLIVYVITELMTWLS